MKKIHIFCMIIALGCFSLATSCNSTDAGDDSSADAGDDSFVEDALTGSNTIEDVTYSFYVPGCAVSRNTPNPVLYTFHGSGGTGMSMVEQWMPVADAQCFVVIGQDSGESKGWGFVNDGERFLQVIDATDQEYHIDETRRYLNGYSAGAHWIYGFGLFNSDEFAGLSVFAGSLTAAMNSGIWPDQIEQPMPIFIAHGTDDKIAPYEHATNAESEFQREGWPVKLWTKEGGTHGYDPAYQEDAWEFWQENVRSSGD